MSGFVVLAIIVVVLIVWATSASARQQQRNQGRHGGRSCPTCGTVHPNFAQFCRHCGRQLP